MIEALIVFIAFPSYGGVSPSCQAAKRESTFLEYHECQVWLTSHSGSLLNYTTGVTMKAFWLAPVFMVLLLSQGCSADSIKRTVYDIFQNWGDQDCHRDPGRECPEPQSYEEYQRERNATSAH